MVLYTIIRYFSTEYLQINNYTRKEQYNFYGALYHAEAFDTPDAENVIKLNGMRSELIISSFEKEG